MGLLPCDLLCATQSPPSSSCRITEEEAQIHWLLAPSLDLEYGLALSHGCNAHGGGTHSQSQGRGTLMERCMRSQGRAHSWRAAHAHGGGRAHGALRREQRNARLGPPRTRSRGRAVLMVRHGRKWRNARQGGRRWRKKYHHSLLSKQISVMLGNDSI